MMSLRRMIVQQRTKKAQLEMNETIMVLFALVIIFGIGMFVYYKFLYQGIEKTGEELGEQESSVLLVSVASLPEIGCDRDFCLDSTKLTLFKIFSRDKEDYYRDKWGYRKIWVEQVYPVVNSNVECSTRAYNSLEYPDNCKYWSLYENIPSDYRSRFIVSSIYPLYFPEKDAYRVGRLNIEVYR